MEEFRTKLPLIVGKKENLVVGKVEEKVPFSPPEFRIRIPIYFNPYHIGGGGKLNHATQNLIISAHAFTITILL